MGNGNRIDAKMQGYEILVSYQSSLSDPARKIGEKGACRFCDEIASSAFKQRAHLIPEALGNKWLFAQDECDSCNKLFGKYDQALADAIGAVLTLGGTKGKKNKVRKTGQSSGLSTLRRTNGADGRPRISAMSDNVDFAGALQLDKATGVFFATLPLPPTPFRPRDAYKSLCKMGVAILPKSELRHFQKLIQWLQDPDDNEAFSNLSVGLSFGLVGNPPPIATVTLMRRTAPDNPTPYMFFILSVGSVCCVIDLMPDTLDDHMPPVMQYSINIAWSVVVAESNASPQIDIDYENPVTLNWASTKMEPQPFESFRLEFDPQTTEGKFTLSYR